MDSWFHLPNSLCACLPVAAVEVSPPLILFSFFLLRSHTRQKIIWISHHSYYIMILRTISFSHHFFLIWSLLLLAHKINPLTTFILMTISVSPKEKKKKIIKRVCALEQWKLSFYWITKSSLNFYAVIAASF